MTEIKFRTPEVIAAEEQARKAALRQAFASGRPTPPVIVRRSVAPNWNDVPPVTPTAIETPPPAPILEPLATLKSEVAAPTTVSINISVPEFRLDSVKNMALKLTAVAQAGVRVLKPLLTVLAKQAALVAKKLPRRQAATAAAVLAVAVGLIGGTIHLWQGHQKQRLQAATVAAAAKVAQTTSTKPTFKPVTPVNKTELANGEAGKTSYDTKHSVFSYADTVKGNAVTVSQQPLPTSFSSPEKAITTIAKSLNATQPIVTNRGTGYVFTDPKSHAQTVVYSFNNLLIYINSPFTQQASDWKSYLENLKQN